MKVVVTGAAGFLGSHLAFSLLGDGHTVIAVDDMSHGAPVFVGKHAKPIDFRDMDVSKGGFANLLSEVKPDAVCHLADASSASTAWDTGLFGRYYDALVSVVTACQAVKVKKFVCASSADYLFGKHCEMPVRDASKAWPANMFGVHKYNCERIVAHMASKGNLRWCILRFPYVYGPSCRHLARKARKGACFIADAIRVHGSVKIPGDGNQSRDFLWVTDAVSALEIALCDRGLIGTANVGTGIETPIIKVIGRLSELLGRKVRVEYLYKKKDDVPRSCVDASTMLEHRWRPKVGIVHGLEAMVNASEPFWETQHDS